MFLIYCTEMLHGMGDQRSTDLGTLKHVGLTYLMPNHEPLEPPINKKEDKSDHGFNHLQIACMLCLHNKLIAFDKDPDMQVPTFSPMQLLTHCRTMGALQEGLINATTCNWPTISYMDDIYDPDDRLKGLFRGHAAFRVSFHLHTGSLLKCLLFPVLYSSVHWTGHRRNGYCRWQHVKAIKERSLGPHLSDPTGHCICTCTGKPELIYSEVVI